MPLMLFTIYSYKNFGNKHCTACFRSMVVGWRSTYVFFARKFDDGERSLPPVAPSTFHLCLTLVDILNKGVIK